MAYLIVESAADVSPEPGAVAEVSGRRHLSGCPVSLNQAVRCLEVLDVGSHMRHLEARINNDKRAVKDLSAWYIQ